MRDKLVDPVGLRNTAKPKKIVFQKRCSYRRKPISRRERLKPTKCEQDAEHKARGAKGAVIRARMRFEVAPACLFTAAACAFCSSFLLQQKLKLPNDQYLWHRKSSTSEGGIQLLQRIT